MCGMRFAEARRRAHALVGAGGRHPDVGDHDVGFQFVDQREQLVFRGGHADNFEIVLPIDELMDAFTKKDVVLGEDDADRHVSRGSC